MPSRRKIPVVRLEILYRTQNNRHRRRVKHSTEESDVPAQKDKVQRFPADNYREPCWLKDTLQKTWMKDHQINQGRGNSPLSPSGQRLKGLIPFNLRPDGDFRSHSRIHLCSTQHTYVTRKTLIHDGQHKWGDILFPGIHSCLLSGSSTTVHRQPRRETKT